MVEDSQREVTTMYLQFQMGDGQEQSYVEDYERLTIESSKEWNDQWVPTLNSEEIEKIAWSLSDMMDGCDKHDNVNRILKVLRPHIENFKAYLDEYWGEDLGYDTAESIGLNESQW